MIIFKKNFNVYVFLRERDRERQRENKQERGRERDTESEAGSRLWAVSTKPDARTHELWDHDLSQSWWLNRLSHPGAPLSAMTFSIWLDITIIFLLQYFIYNTMCSIFNSKKTTFRILKVEELSLTDLIRYGERREDTLRPQKTFSSPPKQAKQSKHHI